MRRLLTLLVLPLVITSRVANAQRAARGGWSVSAGIAGPSTYLIAGSDVRVRSPIGGYAGAAFSRVGSVRARPISSGLFARVASQPVKVRVAGDSYGAGSATSATAGVQLVTPLARRLDLRGALGAAYVDGPGDVLPFSSGSAVHLDGEIGLAFAADAAARWKLELNAVAYRVPSSDAYRAGAVSTLMLGVRRDF